MKSDRNAVLKIATKELRSCYCDDGIIAGTHHFTDYWARDGYFASLGALALGDSKIVKKEIDLFYKYQRSDGLIPYRIMRGPITLGKYFGHSSYYGEPRPTYRLKGYGSEILDGTTLTLLFTAILGLNNLSLKKYIPKIKAALSYLESRESGELLNDGVMAEWNDLVWKWGNLLYSNVIYWYMLDRLSFAVSGFDNKLSTELKKKKQSLGKALHKKLWNGKYFADWYDYKRRDYFYPFGNCLAIVWGLAAEKESASILNQCKKVQTGFTLETNFPKYPWHRIDLLQRIEGMADYQNRSLLWWQPVIAYLAALKKMKRQNEIPEVLNRLTSKVITDQSIYECYERSGKPVKRLIYSAENPFAWSAGMLIWALKL